MLDEAYRKEVAAVVGLNCQLEQILCIIIEWVALGQVARPSGNQQPIDGIKPAISNMRTLCQSFVSTHVLMTWAVYDAAAVCLMSSVAAERRLWVKLSDSSGIQNFQASTQNCLLHGAAVPKAANGDAHQ